MINYLIIDSDGNVLAHARTRVRALAKMKEIRASCARGTTPPFKLKLVSSRSQHAYSLRKIK